MPAADAAVDTPLGVQLLGVQLLGSFLKSRHVLFTRWLLREGAVVKREEGLAGAVGKRSHNACPRPKAVSGFFLSSPAGFGRVE